MRPSTTPDPRISPPRPGPHPSAPGEIGLEAVALAAAVELPQETAAEEITDDQSWLVQRLRDPRTIFSFLLAIALLLFIFTRFDVNPTQIWGVIQHANLAFFALAFIVYYSAFILRGLRWQQLLANVGFSREQGFKIPSVRGLIEIIYLSWFVNCIVPAKLGDAYRSYLLKQAAGISFARTIGTILAERMIDIVILFILLLISAVLTFQGHVPTELNLTIAFGGLLVIILLVGLVAMRRFGDVVERMIPARFRDKYVKLQEGTLQSFRRRSLPTLIGYTAMIWLLEGGRLFFVTRSLDTHIDLAVVIFIALASSLLTTLPLTPGGVGLVEGAVFVVLRTVGVDDATALSIALLDRLINYWSIVGGGIVVYIISHRK